MFFHCRVSVSIDPKNSGEWTDCVNVPNPGLPKNWLKTAYVGVTASTGQLADNHDVISLLSFSDFAVMEQAEIVQKEEKHFDIGTTLEYEERMQR
jgi:lectin, mannose-binding 2